MPGAAPATGIEVTEADPAWPRWYDDLAGRIRQALGWRALQLEHVGSTSVPGLAAKPVIDIDLTVADPGREQDYVPALERIGFRLVIREPWWYGHRALVADDPRCNLHVMQVQRPQTAGPPRHLPPGLPRHRPPRLLTPPPAYNVVVAPMSSGARRCGNDVVSPGTAVGAIGSDAVRASNRKFRLTA